MISGMQDINIAQSRILIVDDMPVNIQILGSTLKRNGYLITYATNGEQALAIADAKVPDLILLDISMPGMDGYTVCAKLKENPKTRMIPVIFLTARSETEDVVRGFDVGAIDYITKPFNPSELTARVKTQLELKHSRDVIFRQNLELSELNASKDKFFSILSHDLRSPFSGILTLSEMLAAEIDQMERDEIKQFATTISRSAKNLFGLLNNLLTWSRMQTGRMQFLLDHVSLQEVFAHILTVLESNVLQKKIFVDLKDFGGIALNADRTMAISIFHNLMTNALKFTKPEGSIIIEANVTEKEGTPFAEILINDNGVGMNERTLEGLFKIDVQQKSKGTAGETGSGLGLLLVKEMVEKHGGSIAVKSSLGIGSTFTVLLPLFVEGDNITEEPAHDF